MKQALIDTDTLSYFFRNNPEVVEKLDKYLQEFGFVNISVITYYEVLCFRALSFRRNLLCHLHARNDAKGSYGMTKTRREDCDKMKRASFIKTIPFLFLIIH
jgi:predicted nucleic acid-binding protein